MYLKIGPGQRLLQDKMENKQNKDFEKEIAELKQKIKEFEKRFDEHRHDGHGFVDR